jgi:hypothetical protein
MKHNAILNTAHSALRSERQSSRHKIIAQSGLGCVKIITTIETNLKEG